MQGTASLRHKPHGVMAVISGHALPAQIPSDHIAAALVANLPGAFSLESVGSSRPDISRPSPVRPNAMPHQPTQSRLPAHRRERRNPKSAPNPTPIAMA